MKIIAKRSVQLNGHIYAKGEAAEYDGPIDSRMADLFTDKDGSALTVGQTGDRGGTGKPGVPSAADREAGRIDNLVKTIGRKGIAQKLDDLGVTFPPSMGTPALARLLLQQQGEIKG